MGKRLQRFYERFFSLKGDPRHIAMGFAAGVAIGFFPLLGTHTLLVLALASLFRMHLGALYIGSWVSANPLTFAPILAGEFYLGKHLLHLHEITMPAQGITWSSAFEIGWGVLMSLLAGYAVLGAIFAAATYPIVRWSIVRVRARKGIPE